MMTPYPGKPTPSDEAALRAIARHAGVTPARVQARHREEWQRLESRACIRDFIPLLALKHVRDIFRQMPAPETAASRRPASRSR